jgi:hypothetical protein
MTAAEIANLETARANFASKLAEVSANPLPDYTVGNTTMSFVAYYKFLREEIEKLDDLIAAAEDGGDAWEERSVGVT